MKKALIIGTGLGGLTTAMRLTTLGYEVEMVEKHHQAGGRLNQLKKDGFTWDLAPTFFSMSYEFDEFAKSCNLKLPFDFFHSTHCILLILLAAQKNTQFTRILKS